MKKLLIVPYGTPKWGIASNNMKSVLRSVKNLDVMYLCPMWGLVEAKRFDHSLLTGAGSVSERVLTRTTALMIRSFLLEQSKDYQNIVIINYGPGMQYWNAGAQRTSAMRKVKIVRYLPQSNYVIKKVIKELNLTKKDEQ
jgi:hypothetical protein